MAFSEAIKLKVRQKANWQCCICEAFVVETHHIISREEEGPDTEDNAAPLFPSCHDLYGANPQKRKFIREKRDDWYIKCQKESEKDKLLEDIISKLENVPTRDDFISFKNELMIGNIRLLQDKFKPNLILIDKTEDLNILMAKKKFDDAIKLLKKNLADQFILLGHCYGEKSDIKEMLNSFDLSVSFDGQNNSKVEKLKEFFWAQVFNKGVALYQRGIKLNESSEAKNLLNESIINFQLANSIKPKSSETLKNLAFVHLSCGDNSSAVGPLKEIIEIEKILEGYRFLGEIYYANGMEMKTRNRLDESRIEFNKGIAVLEEGLLVYPKNSELLNILSNCYIGADRTNDAINPIKQGIEAEPENKFYRYNYGVLLLGLEDFYNAEIQFKKAIEIDKNYENAIFNLGVTYLKWGTHLQKEADKRSDPSEEYKIKYRHALPFMERSAEIEKTNLKTWELLGRIYSVLEMNEEATNAFLKAEK